MLGTAILAALVPAAVAAVLLALVFRVWRRGSAAGGAHGSIPVALAAAFCSGAVLLYGWPTVPPVAATDWLFLLLVGVAALAAVDASWRAPTAVRWLVGLAVSLAVPRLLFQQMLTHTWTGADGWIWTGSLGVALFVVWTGLETLASRVPGPFLPLALTLVASTAALALLTSGSALLGQLAGALAAGLGALFLLTLLRRDLAIARGGVAVPAVALGGLVGIGYFYAELPWTAALLLLGAPLLGWLGELRPLRRLGPWSALAIRTLLVVPALAGAIWVVFHPPGEANDGGERYEYEMDYDSLGG